MAKRKFAQQIRDAWRAYKYGPNIFRLAAPPVAVHQVLTAEYFHTLVEIPEYIESVATPEAIDRDAELEIAKRIGKLMMASGAVEVHKLGRLRRGYIAYRGQVQVIMPVERREEAEP